MRDSWDARMIVQKRSLKRDETARPLMLVYGDLLESAARVLRDHLAAREQLVRLVCARHGHRQGLRRRRCSSASRESARRFWRNRRDAGSLRVRRPSIDAVTAWRTLVEPGFLSADCHPACTRSAWPWPASAPVDREMTRADNLCPFCGGAPQVSDPTAAGFARPAPGISSAAPARRTWPFRETRCADCGETEPRRHRSLLLDCVHVTCAWTPATPASAI